MNAPSWFDPGRSPSPVPSTLFTVVNRIREASSDPAYRSFPGPGPMVAGLLVPPFQRGVVWNEERMVRFVDSARRGLPLGTYTVNETYGMEEARRREDGRTWYFGDLWLLDGLQRMTALSRFFEDGFAVHGAFWSGVGEDERRAFLMGVKFPYVETRFANEADAAEYYDLMNFGGVAHAEGDRAVPSPAR